MAPFSRIWTPASAPFKGIICAQSQGFKNTLLTMPPYSACWCLGACHCFTVSHRRPSPPTSMTRTKFSPFEGTILHCFLFSHAEFCSLPVHFVCFLYAGGLPVALRHRRAKRQETLCSRVLLIFLLADGGFHCSRFERGPRAWIVQLLFFASGI